MRLEKLDKPVPQTMELTFQSGMKQKFREFNAQYVIFNWDGTKAYFPNRPEAISAINQAVNQSRREFL